MSLCDHCKSAGGGGSGGGDRGGCGGVLENNRCGLCMDLSNPFPLPRPSPAGRITLVHHLLGTTLHLMYIVNLSTAINTSHLNAWRKRGRRRGLLRTIKNTVDESPDGPEGGEDGGHGKEGQRQHRRPVKDI